LQRRVVREQIVVFERRWLIEDFVELSVHVSKR